MTCLCPERFGGVGKGWYFKRSRRYSGDTIDWANWPKFKRFESTATGREYWDRVRTQVRFELDQMKQWSIAMKKKQRAIKNVRWSDSVDEAEARKKDKQRVLATESMTIRNSLEIFPDRIPFTVRPPTPYATKARWERSEEEDTIQSEEEDD